MSAPIPDECVRQIRERLKAHPIVVQIPSGLESDFTGVIDLIAMREIVWSDDTLGATFVEDEIPAALLDQARAARAEMIEALGEVDDEVMTLFLEESNPSADVLRAALRRATIAGRAVPVLLGAAFKNKGVQPLAGRRRRLSAVAVRHSARSAARIWRDCRPRAPRVTTLRFRRWRSRS